MARRTCVALMVLAAAPALAGASAPVAMARPVEFPHAGIALAVPERFESVPLTEPFDVTRAVLWEKDRPAQAVSLSAFPTDGAASAETFADGMLAELGRSLAIRNLTVLKRTPIKVAGIAGVAQRLSYTYRGVETAAARVYFIREVKDSKLRICYVLTVESTGERAATLVPILGEVIKGVSLTPVRRASELGVGELGKPLRDARRGYSIRPPSGWYADFTPAGVQTARTDYLLGGAPMPVAQVVVAEMPQGATPQSYAAHCLEVARAKASEQNLAAAVLSEGPAAMGGLDGRQFVLQQSPKARPPEGQQTQEEGSLVIVQRIVCQAADDQPGVRAYSLVVLFPGADARPAEAMMEKIAAGFELLAPASAPSTTPATAPATAATPVTLPTTAPSSTAAPAPAPAEAPTRPAGEQPAETSTPPTTVPTAPAGDPSGIVTPRIAPAERR